MTTQIATADEISAESAGEGNNGAVARQIAHTPPWPVERARHLLVRHHLLRPSLDSLPTTADALLAHLHDIDAYASILHTRTDTDLGSAEPALGVIAIRASDGDVLVPQPDGPAWLAGLRQPIRLAENADLHEGQLIGSRLDTGEPIDVTANRGLAHPGAAHLGRMQTHPVLQVHSFVRGRTVASARWRLNELTRPDNGDATHSKSLPVEGETSATQAMVLDLRYCAGGDVFEATDFGGLWMESRQPWTTLRRAPPSPPTHLSAGMTGGPSFTPPDVVLVSRYTASACEQLVNGLVRYTDARVIGERTAGKCTVQSTHRLDDTHSIRFTTGRWTLPDGTPCDPDGVEPHVMLKEDHVHADTVVAAVLHSPQPGD